MDTTVLATFKFMDSNMMSFDFYVSKVCWRSIAVDPLLQTHGMSVKQK
jgi:hypothetical protein